MFKLVKQCAALGVFFFVAWMQLAVVPTGFVGVRATFGAIGEVLSPGAHVTFGSIVTIAIVDIKPQVDTISPIECSTKEGITITFPRIKVYNQLPASRAMHVIREYGYAYDDILINAYVVQQMLELCNDMSLEEIRENYSEMNDNMKETLQQHQASRQTGLVITDVVVHKPVFPAEIQQNYNRKAAERTALQAEADTQARKLKESQTAKMMKEEAEIVKLMEEEYAGKIQKAQAETKASVEKIKVISAADATRIASEAEANRIKVIAAANKELHTDKWLQAHYQENVVKNAQAYYGAKLPQYVGGPLVATAEKGSSSSSSA